MSRQLFAFSFHLYTLAAVAYLVYLARPYKGLAWVARGGIAIGLGLHGAGLFFLLQGQHGVLSGMGQGVAAVIFLVLALYLLLDLVYRLPVLGAFLTPMALALWVPGLWIHSGVPASADKARFLPLHITIALLGVAAFALAAGVAFVYLLMERQVKGKRFGLLFTRLPSLQSLDEMNRWLVFSGFVAISFTLVTGAFFASNVSGLFWAWQPKEIATVAAWALSAVVLVARVRAGWRGRRVAWLTMAGFCVLVLCFISSYGVGSSLRGVP